MDIKYDSNDIENYLQSNINSSHPIIKALKSGKLIIFIGAGMSVHLGVPSWREFALKYLDLVYENNNLTSMNYKTKESLKKENTRKILSLCKFVAKNNLSIQKRNNAYEKWFKVDLGKVKEGRLYEKLYNLYAIYITTNYDNALDLLAQQKKSKELSIKEQDYDEMNLRVDTRGHVYYEIKDFTSDNLQMGNIIHIHGSIENYDELVISNEDYIDRYSNTHCDNIKKQLQKKYSDFLSSIFNNDYVILFMGYGLQELEILQYLFEDELKENKAINNNKYLLLSCYSDDYFKISYLANYYENCYGINIIPCDMTNNGYEKIEEFIDHINNLKENYKPTKSKTIDALKRGIELIEEL